MPLWPRPVARGPCFRDYFVSQGARPTGRIEQPDGPVRDRVARDRGQSRRARGLSGAWINGVHRRWPPDDIILDLDSSESPTFGQQEGPA